MIKTLYAFRSLLVVALLLSLVVVVQFGSEYSSTLTAIKNYFAGNADNVPPVALVSTTARDKQFSPAISQVSDEILLRFKDSVTEEEQERIIKGWGFSKKEEIKQVKIKVLSVPEEARDAIIAALSKNPKIDFVEPNWLLPPSFTPNDQYYSNAWHLPKISLPEAWDATQGNSNITIAILDSGVDVNHPDLSGKIVAGRNTYDNNTDVTDVTGHGTTVAGSAAAMSNNTIGVAAPAIKNSIMPLRVTNTSGWGVSSAITSGLTWAADNGAKVANLSFGGIHSSASVKSAAQYFKSKGGLVVAAAGNYGTDDGLLDNSEIISVSATGNTDQLASWSSFGKYIDVSAPGVGIYSTLKGGVYSPVSGTSFSSPVTAGVIALIYSAKSGLTPQQVEQYLEQGADDLGDSGYDIKYGWGRINAARSIALALGSTSTPPVPSPSLDTTSPSVGIVFPTNGTTVSGTVSVNINASDASGVAKVELYVDGVLKGSDTSSPFVIAWVSTSASNGNHTLQARAYDSVGNVGLSDINTINVNNTSDTVQPVVSITEPSANSTIPSKGQLTIHVTAKDNVAVKQIDILFDGLLRNSCSNTTSCSTRVNINKVSAGPHSISARATDTNGNVATATIVVSK